MRSLFPKKRPVKLKAGDWLSPRNRSWAWEGHALVEEVNDDVVVIRRSLQHESETAAHSYVTARWAVMRPNYRSRRDRAMPSWVELGARYTLYLDVAVYEIIEIRGAWMLSRDTITGSLRFTRARDIYRERPVPNRFQRILG